MKVTLTIEPHYITFLTSEGDNISEIRKCDLGETIDIVEGRISYWLHYLTFKNWMTTEMANQLSDIIKHEVSDNDIDWDATQDFVEGYLSL